MSQQTKTQVSRNDTRYREILNNFAGNETIQGTEDWPIDPSPEDIKTIGVGVLFGMAALAVTPSEFEFLGFIAAGIFVAATALVVYVAPDDRSPLKWMQAIMKHKTREKRLTQHAESSKKSTQTLTRVERVLTFSDAVLRQDGTIVGAVKIDGRDMSLAEESEWTEASNGFEQLANSIDNGFEIYSPARIVESNALVKGYRERELDEDVKQNPTLSKLINTYQTELPRSFRNRGVAVRDFYVIVWVTEREVRHADHNVLTKLSQLPGVGSLIERFGLDRRGPNEKEIRNRQKSMLEGRKRSVVTAVSSIEECEAEKVDAEHLVAILREYWSGIRTPRTGTPLHKQRLPIVANGSNHTEHDSDSPEHIGGY